MTVPSYTEEDVELVARALPIDYDDHTTVVEVHAGTGPEGPRIIWGDPKRVARAILAALSSAGRLVPPEPDWTKVTDLVVEWPPYGRSPSVPDTEEGSNGA